MGRGKEEEEGKGEKGWERGESPYQHNCFRSRCSTHRRRFDKPRRNWNTWFSTCPRTVSIPSIIYTSLFHQVMVASKKKKLYGCVLSAEFYTSNWTEPIQKSTFDIDLNVTVSGVFRGGDTGLCPPPRDVGKKCALPVIKCLMDYSTV